MRLCNKVILDKLKLIIQKKSLTHDCHSQLDWESRFYLTFMDSSLCWNNNNMGDVYIFVLKFSFLHNLEK